MPSDQWARLNEDVFCGLRRGAWYRVIFAGPDLVAVDVERAHLLVPRHILEFADVRPALWSLVLHANDSFSFPPNEGRRYVVCPSCRDRQVPIEYPTKLRCRRCNGLFEVDWDEPTVVRRTSSQTHAIAG